MVAGGIGGRQILQDRWAISHRIASHQRCSLPCPVLTTCVRNISLQIVWRSMYTHTCLRITISTPLHERLQISYPRQPTTSTTITTSTSTSTQKRQSQSPKNPCYSSWRRKWKQASIIHPYPSSDLTFPLTSPETFPRANPNPDVSPHLQSQTHGAVAASRSVL